MPYPGQNEPKELKPAVKEAKVAVQSHTSYSKPAASVTAAPAERKKTVQLSGAKLSSKNLGIESILNPKQKKSNNQKSSILQEKNEKYSPDEFDHAWKEFALGVKREKKDSLFTTLMSCEKNVDSQHMINMLIQNTIQETELDLIKGDLVRFLREKLQNTNIDLSYTITETKSVAVMDSKGTFDKLAEENSSLNKFRKLFNLDIEF